MDAVWLREKERETYLMRAPLAPTSAPVPYARCNNDSLLKRQAKKNHQLKQRVQALVNLD
jgi:hypothetical protein